MSRRPDCSIVIQWQALERGREWIKYQEPNVCLSREVKQIDQVFVEAEGKLFLSKSGCGHLQDLQTLIRPRGVVQAKAHGAVLVTPEERDQHRRQADWHLGRELFVEAIPCSDGQMCFSDLPAAVVTAAERKVSNDTLGLGQ